jgi:hypothetical protein
LITLFPQFYVLVPSASLAGAKKDGTGCAEITAHGLRQSR